jgi:hypothetical protein
MKRIDARRKDDPNPSRCKDENRKSYIEPSDPASERSSGSVRFKRTPKIVDRKLVVHFHGE